MADETAEVRSLLMRHRLSIVRDLVGTGLLQVLLKGGVLTVAQEEQLNAEDSLEVRCERLIELIAGGGFEQFKQFCYAIESECSQLISDLINDKLSQVDDGDGESQRRKHYDHHPADNGRGDDDAANITSATVAATEAIAVADAGAHSYAAITQAPTITAWMMTTKKATGRAMRSHQA
uniref:Uncharacterized protein n=1 Tax=Anopheles albimanus TaxID=7167 RepID=A0A182F7Q4_ANOAL